jgi:hypothetical protein
VALHHGAFHGISNFAEIEWVHELESYALDVVFDIRDHDALDLPRPEETAARRQTIGLRTRQSIVEGDDSK